MPFDVLFDTAPNSQLAQEAEFYLVTEAAVCAVLESNSTDLLHLRLPEVEGPFCNMGSMEALAAVRAGDADILRDRYEAEAYQVAERAWRDWREPPPGARIYP